MLEWADVRASRPALLFTTQTINNSNMKYFANRSITEHDKDFAKVYLVEKQTALEMMDKGDPDLRAKAMEIVNAG